MRPSLIFIRALFTVISIIFMVTYTLSYLHGPLINKVCFGILVGLGFAGLLMIFERIFYRSNLRTFNIATLGLFLGYLMGQALVITFNAISQISNLTTHLNAMTSEMIKIGLYLFGTYFGTLLTLKFADELHMSIPFVRLSSTTKKKRDILLDISILNDMRLIDLCASKLLDDQLILPKFLIKEFYTQIEAGEEREKTKAKRALDIIKKLENITGLGMRINDTDFPDLTDITQKTIRLARLLDAILLTADLTKLQLPAGEEVELINIHSLSNALKPIMVSGEQIYIKVQRYGKEPRQGVGYLEDGTMVVINNGGDYIGEMIATQVISVKQTSAGRIIFTNAVDELASRDHQLEELQPAYHSES